MFAKAITIRPDDAAAATLRVTALRADGADVAKLELLEAAKHSADVTEQYLALNPDDALALSRAAVELISTGDIDKGLEWAERAYTINIDLCGYNVACAFVLAGKTERAWISSKKAVDHTLCTRIGSSRTATGTVSGIIRASRRC